MTPCQGCNGQRAYGHDGPCTAIAAAERVLAHVPNPDAHICARTVIAQAKEIEELRAALAEEEQEHQITVNSQLALLLDRDRLRAALREASDALACWMDDYDYLCLHIDDGRDRPSLEPSNEADRKQLADLRSLATPPTNPEAT